MAPSAEYYKLNMASLPDALYKKTTPVEKWLEHAESTKDKNGFPPNSLNQPGQLESLVEYERLVGISLYMIGNVSPFAIVVFGILSIFSSWARILLTCLLSYIGILYSLERFYFAPIFLERYERTSAMTNDIKDNQYLYTERNTSKYMNTTIVWPKSLHQSKDIRDKPVIFCLVPHGVAPLGATAYPMWSKIWSSCLCHWTCAPVVLQLPWIGYFMDKIGYIPAKAKPMLDTLTKKEESVGVFLDGIDGMFQVGANTERAVLKKRKGIIKIALRAGVPIIPAYAFGHTAAYKVWVDPFGILKTLSLNLQTSLTPFFGRYGWFLGPPKRVPITICLGDPIQCPQTAEPTQAEIDEYHAKMVEGFQVTFDSHKTAYGWEKKELKIV